MARVMLAVLLLFTLNASIADAQSVPAPKDLAGRWVSPECEKYPNADGTNNYVKRDFSITESSWSILYMVFGDANCSDAAKLLTARVLGPYSLGQNSKTVAGAREGVFSAPTKFLTIHNDALLGAVKNCGNGNWKLNAEQDVAEKGCLTLDAVKDCKAEYDLVKLNGNDLFFGQRSENMCVEGKYPAAVVSYPVRKVVALAGGGGGQGGGSVPATAPSTGFGGQEAQSSNLIWWSVVGLLGTLAASSFVIIRRKNAK